MYGNRNNLVGFHEKVPRAAAEWRLLEQNFYKFGLISGIHYFDYPEVAHYL